jgi:beta-alanine degradation protein BauB
MPSTLSWRRALLACVVSFSAGAGAVYAQQQTQQTRREPQFENAHLKVWKSIILPNQPLTQHRHDHGRALVALTDGVLDVVSPTGKTLTTYRWEKGRAYWLDADPAGETHADVNNTGQPIEVIVVELKNDR